MAADRHSSRHGHRRQRSNRASPRLIASLRVFVDVLTGRHRSGASQHLARRPVQERRSWLVHTEVSVLHVCAVVGLSIGLIWIGWHIVADTAAQRLAYSAPEKALGWVPNNSAALDQIAENELMNTTGDVDRAQRSAEQALRLNPLDSRALFLLAVAAERKGDAEKAAALMRMAGTRTWRDFATQVWLFNEETSHGRFSEALPHADAVLRANPNIWTRIFQTLDAFPTNPKAFKALAEFLTTDPPWRTVFLSELSTRLADSSQLDELFSTLQNSNKPPTKKEWKVYLDRLVKDGRFAQAYRAWQNNLPRDQRPVPAQLYNGDFEFPTDGSPFNWVMTSSPGADIQIASLAENRRALRVQFSGTRVSFNVTHLMMLRPGTYNFSGQVKAEALQSSRGLWWRVFCANKSTTALGHTELVSKAIPWTKFAIDFRVPEDDCEAQWLQLELPARVASEREIEGEVWYQFLRISPLEAQLPQAN